MNRRWMVAAAAVALSAVGVGGVLWRDTGPSAGDAVRAAADAVAEGRYEDWVRTDREAARIFRETCVPRIEHEMGLAILSSAIRDPVSSGDLELARDLAGELTRISRCTMSEAGRRRAACFQAASEQAVRRLAPYAPREWVPITAPVERLPPGSPCGIDGRAPD